MIFRPEKSAFITVFGRFSIVFNQMVIRCPSEAADGGDRVEIWGERLLIASFPSFWEGAGEGEQGVIWGFQDSLRADFEPVNRNFWLFFQPDRH